MEYEDIVAAIAIIDMASDRLEDIDGLEEHDDFGLLGIMHETRNALNAQRLAALPDGAVCVDACTLTAKS